MPKVYVTRADLAAASAEEQTHMEYVWASAYFTNLDTAAGDNARAVAEYNVLFEQYAKAMDNRPDLTPSVPPPVPALAENVRGDGTGWSEIVQSTTERVCATKVYQPAVKPVPGEGLIGQRITDDWFVCLPGDTTAGGKVVPGASKDTPPVVGLFKKVASPIQSSGAGSPGAQVLGWWQKVG